MLIYEFEFFKGDEYILAVPFDFDGGTQGRDLHDAVDMAYDWLFGTVQWELQHGHALPNATFDNEPKHGGKIIAIAINPDVDEMSKITSAEAARRLGVTPGRVSQMLKSGKLAGYKDGRTTWVMLDSVIARDKSTPSAGRPKKHEAMQA